MPLTSITNPPPEGDVSVKPSTSRPPRDGIPITCLRETDSPTEWDFTPENQRQDIGAAPSPVKLDTRGSTPHVVQKRFEFDRHLVRHQVIDRLLSAGAKDLAEPLQRCHTDRVIKRCTSCDTISTFWNRCDKSYCPSCQPRLSRERKESIEWWTHQITQPKHIVLTCRNSHTLTKDAILGYKGALRRLLHQKIARHWKGGCYSLEITNEGRGWHVHFHILTDARWVDQPALAQAWGKLVGQDFAIVHVQDCRGKDYLREVTKYAVKGTDLATWEPADVVTYIRAMSGVRAFGTWGTLFKRNAAFREWLHDLQRQVEPCPCGCTKFEIMSEDEWDWYCAAHGTHPPPAPAPAPAPATPEHPQLPLPA